MYASKCCLIIADLRVPAASCQLPAARRSASSRCLPSKFLQRGATTAAATRTVASPQPSHCNPSVISRPSARRRTSKAVKLARRGTTPNRMQLTVLLHRMAFTCVAIATSWLTRRGATSSRWRCSFSGNATPRTLSSNASTRQVLANHLRGCSGTAKRMKCSW